MSQIRVYLELKDEWCSKRHEHFVSVYLTTQSNPGGDLVLNRQFSHSFVFRRQATPNTADKHPAQATIVDDLSGHLHKAKYILGTIKRRFSHSFVFRRQTTPSTADKHPAQATIVDGLSEHLHKAIYVFGTPFIPKKVAYNSDETTKYLKKIGESLFEALCQQGSIVASLFDKFDNVSKYKDLAFTLVTNSSLLDSISWEYAYRRGNENRKGYFLVQKHIFSRGLHPFDQPPLRKRELLRINILAVPSKPLTTEDDDSITVDGEWRTMSGTFNNLKRNLTLRRVVPPTFAKFKECLGQSRYQIILFSGHGVFADIHNAGQDFAYCAASNLKFEENNAAEDLKPLDVFLGVVQEEGGCELIFLNCCESTSTPNYSTIAHALKDIGVGHLIGMSQQVPDGFARKFSDSFFRTIVGRGKTIEKAVLYARSMVSPDQIDCIGIPVLYTSGASIETTFDCLPGSPTIEHPSPVCHLGAINMKCEIVRGRSEEIMAYAKAILDNDRIRIHTIIGAPGIGKTTVAYKVAEIVSRSVDGGVYGFSFESVPSEAEFLRRLYVTLQLDTTELGNTPTAQTCIPAIKRTLRYGRTVLFFDHFETLLTEKDHDVAVLLRRLLQEVPSLTYLVTSRNVLDWQMSEEQHIIEVLPPNAAVKLFRDHLRRQWWEGEARLASNDTLIQDLCEQIGYHTLSVTLLASEFDQLNISLTDFVHDVINRLHEPRGGRILQVLDICLRRSVEALDEEARMALAMTALLGSVFREDDFSKLINNIFVNSNQEQPIVTYFNPEKAYLPDLVDRSLLTRSIDNKIFHMLPPIREYVLDQYGPSHTPLYQRTLTILNRLPGCDHLHIATILHTLATIYQDQGKYTEAEPLYQEALTIRKRSLGSDHLLVATITIDFASLYRDHQGKYLEAERLYQDALTIQEKSLESDHFDIASTLNNLATLCQNQGEYAKAEPLYQRALTIQEKSPGSNHPDIATTLNNIASIYRVKGNYEEAEPLYHRALIIQEKSLRSNHRDIATTLNNLAELYQLQGKYAEAEPLYRCALTTREKSLGPGHPDIATTLNNLAKLYRNQGKYAEAESTYQRALAVGEKSLGFHHPSVATTRHNLMELYQNHLDNLVSQYFGQDKYSESKPLYQRVLAVQEKSLDFDHPDTAATLNNLARLYRNHDRYTEAEQLYQRALAIQEKSLDPDHLDIARILINLAELYLHQSKSAEAKPLYQRLGAIRARNLRYTFNSRSLDGLDDDLQVTLVLAVLYQVHLYGNPGRSREMSFLGKWFYEFIKYGFPNFFKDDRRYLDELYVSGLLEQSESEYETTDPFYTYNILPRVHYYILHQYGPDNLAKENVLLKYLRCGKADISRMIRTFPYRKFLRIGVETETADTIAEHFLGLPHYGLPWKNTLYGYFIYLMEEEKKRLEGDWWREKERKAVPNVFENALQETLIDAYLNHGTSIVRNAIKHFLDCLHYYHYANYFYDEKELKDMVDALKSHIPDLITPKKTPHTDQPTDRLHSFVKLTNDRIYQLRDKAISEDLVPMSFALGLKSGCEIYKTSDSIFGKVLILKSHSEMPGVAIGKVKPGKYQSHWRLKFPEDKARSDAVTWKLWFYFTAQHSKGKWFSGWHTFSDDERIVIGNDRTFFSDFIEYTAPIPFVLPRMKSRSDSYSLSLTINIFDDTYDQSGIMIDYVRLQRL